MLQEIMFQLGLNQSFFVHFLLFVGVFFVFKYTFFSPILRRLYKRDEKTTLLSEQIRELNDRCRQRESEYQKKKTNIQREYTALLERYNQQARGVYRELMGQGRAEASSQLTKHREKLAAQYQELKDEIILSLNDIKKSLGTHLC